MAKEQKARMNARVKAGRQAAGRPAGQPSKTTNEAGRRAVDYMQKQQEALRVMSRRSMQGRAGQNDTDRDLAKPRVWTNSRGILATLNHTNGLTRTMFSVLRHLTEPISTRCLSSRQPDDSAAVM